MSRLSLSTTYWLIKRKIDSYIYNKIIFPTYFKKTYKDIVTPISNGEYNHTLCITTEDRDWYARKLIREQKKEEEAHRKYLEKNKRYLIWFKRAIEWHKWFAWHPVKICKNKYVWLIFVDRRLGDISGKIHINCFGYTGFEYRKVGE